MKILKLWTLLLSALSFSHCKTIDYTPKDFSGDSISWGSGGGITGQESSTTILDNGHYFHGQGLTEIKYEHRGKLNTGDVTQLFENYSVLRLHEIQYNQPGNIYRFIERNSESGSHRIVWSSARDLPSIGPQTMYNILVNKTQANKE